MNYLNKVVNAKRLFGANRLKIKKSDNEMQISPYVEKTNDLLYWLGS